MNQLVLPFWSSSPLIPFAMILSSAFMIVFLDSLVGVKTTLVVIEFSLEVFLMMDFLSVSFFLTVATVSFSVLLYSIEYMKDSTLKKKFINVMVIFIMSMVLLVFSVDLYWVMVGWDGLGLSSLILIIYFQNWKSFNSGMVTFLSNRLGDSSLILAIIWSFSLTSGSFLNWSDSTILSLTIIIAALSKSAQLPFSAWLPLAMAAPTPVSSLVHSSTLITAGVYLLIRFNKLISSNFMSMIFFISSLTILLAGFSSLGEFDFKKVIALSTLSHVGLMIMFLSIGSHYCAMIHLYCHAMFKSLLFLISGNVIHENSNSQDLRILSFSTLDPLSLIGIIVSLLSMIGIPFFSGFFSKELLLLSSSGKGEVLLVFIMAASLTSSYSMRIFLSLHKNKKTCSKSNSSNWMTLLIMTLHSTLSGSLILSALKTEGTESIELTPLFFTLKKWIFGVIFLGMIMGLSFSVLQGKWDLYKLIIQSSHQMWWILSFSIFYQQQFFRLSWLFMFILDSKGLIDHVMINKKSSLMMTLYKLIKMSTSLPLSVVSLTTSSLILCLVLLS